MNKKELVFDELAAIAEEFIKIVELNALKGWFTISAPSYSGAITDELIIKVYQPESGRYSLTEGYTHIEIGEVTIGEYARLKYKMSLSPKELDALCKKAGGILEEFKVFSFGNLAAKRVLEQKGRLRMAQIEVKKRKKELRDLEEELKKYQSYE